MWICCANPKLTELLISYGADVTNRPYIASLISYVNLADKDPIKERAAFYKEHSEVSITYEHDVYQSVKILLESGADPNFKCIYGEKSLFPATDWNYRRYFNKYGDTAINQAIKYNAFKITKLLIAYGAKLDDKSFAAVKKATELSGSTEMEELVKAQWIRQNGN